jgi:putative membrane protein
MKIKYLGLFLIAAASVPLSAQTAPPPPPPEAKTSAMPYVMAAGMSDLYEINSSQVALQKSQNPAVRKFASMLIKHHQMTTAATMKAAKKAGLAPKLRSIFIGAIRPEVTKRRFACPQKPPFRS